VQGRGYLSIFLARYTATIFKLDKSERYFGPFGPFGPAHRPCPGLPNNDNTLEILITTAQEAWQQLDRSILEGLSESMPRRVQAVIESNGWHTKY
jgi:hypothetical protein